MPSDRISGTNTVAQNLEIAQADGNISSTEINDIVSAARENGVTRREVGAARAWLDRARTDIERHVAESNPDLSAETVSQLVGAELASSGLTEVVSSIEHQLGETRRAQSVFTDFSAGWLSATSTMNN
jgi:hypothetical protein